MKITLPKHPIRDMTRQEKLLWLGSAGAVLLANLCSGAPDGLTLCAALVGVTSLVLAAGGNVWSQILMILFSLLYGAICFRFRLPSMDKGKYGFSGRKPRPASFSSLTGDSPPASSASLPTISAPEKLRRTFQRGKIRAGEEEDDGGVAWHLPPGLPRPVPLGRGWRPPRTMTMSSADFLPLESVFALVHRGYRGR